MSEQFIISFSVDGVPKAQPRPRAMSFKGHARVFDAGTAEGWKSLIAEAARPHLPLEPLGCALGMKMRYYIKRPKSHFGTGRNDRVLKASAPRHPRGKPDLDNLEKAVLDTMTQIGMWIDDAIVCGIVNEKRYTASDRPIPGLVVTITPMWEM